ncbi:hypothetical protein CLF_111217 [Clonorchis sinensis]|uniref:Uncharacterized protein n=1 Tax=Clonorchis sinensis TaxID=79923 RepID=G7YLH9_CLOSI|nr:hypothetical protein CLF_111217 [Clonorchis sinensis]
MGVLRLQQATSKRNGKSRNPEKLTLHEQPAYIPPNGQLGQCRTNTHSCEICKSCALRTCDLSHSTPSLLYTRKIRSGKVTNDRLESASGRLKYRLHQSDPLEHAIQKDVNDLMSDPHEEGYAPPGKTYALIKTTDKTQLLYRLIWTFSLVEMDGPPKDDQFLMRTPEQLSSKYHFTDLPHGDTLLIVHEFKAGSHFPSGSLDTLNEGYVLLGSLVYNSNCIFKKRSYVGHTEYVGVHASNTVESCRTIRRTTKPFDLVNTQQLLNGLLSEHRKTLSLTSNVTIRCNVARERVINPESSDIWNTCFHRKSWTPMQPKFVKCLYSQNAYSIEGPQLYEVYVLSQKALEELRIHSCTACASMNTALCRALRKRYASGTTDVNSACRLAHASPRNCLPKRHSQYHCGHPIPLLHERVLLNIDQNVIESKLVKLLTTFICNGLYTSFGDARRWKGGTRERLSEGKTQNSYTAQVSCCLVKFMEHKPPDSELTIIHSLPKTRSKTISHRFMTMKKTVTIGLKTSLCSQMRQLDEQRRSSNCIFSLCTLRNCIRLNGRRPIESSLFTNPSPNV